MNGIEALRMATYQRVLSTAAGAGCLLLVAFGLWVGAWDALETIATDWPRPNPVEVATTEAAVGGLFVLLGLTVWWIAAAAIAHHVHAVVVADAAAGHPEAAPLKSELRSALDEHLERWETELEGPGPSRTSTDITKNWYRRD